MLVSYLKTALRSLLRHRLFAAVNIAGLAVGLACSVAIFAFVWHESTYESFNARHARTFSLGGWLPAPVTGLVRDLPGVERAGHRWVDALPLIRNATLQAHQTVTGADAHLLEMLDIPFVAGDRATALSQPYSVAISEEMARRYFGDADPMGGTLRWDDLFDLQVTGVYRLPTNTFFRHGIVFSTEILPVDPQFKGRTFDDWRPASWMRFHNFVQLREGVSPEGFRDDLRAALVAAGQGEMVAGWEANGWFPPLQPIAQLHRPPYLPLLASVGAFVLLIACVNYVNLSTARSTQRVREVGLRRTIGAQRRQLAGQFLLESGLQALLAAALAALLVLAIRPWFTAVSGVDPYAVAARDRGMLWPLCGLGLVTILGAAYPAFALARLHPARVFKDASGAGGGASLRRRLVEFQFAMAILLVVGTAAVAGQLRMMRNADVGFDRSHVIVFKTGYGGVYDRTGEIAADMAAVPGVAGAGRHQSMPFSTRQFRGKLRLEGGRSLEPYFWFVDEGFVDVTRLRLIAGRGARAGLSADRPELVLNESALGALGFESPAAAIGRTAEVEAGLGTIVGVVDDFHLMSLHHVTGAAVLQTPRHDDDYGVENYSHIAVRLEPAALPEVLDRLQAVWTRYAPGWPLNYHFLDQDFDRQYRAEARLSSVLSAFAGMALLVTGLGVFALAAFSTRQRTREIGIRKAVGATGRHILLLLSKDFGRLFLAAAAVALPAGYWAAESWLESFAYRIRPGVPLLAGSALAVLIVAAGAVSQQVWRATRTNPVEALRCE